MKETSGSPWKTTHLQVVRAEDIGYPDESSVMIDGNAFTGILIEEDSTSISYHRTVVRGRNDGPCYYRRDNGTLAEYGNYYGGLDRGPSHEWDEHGNLIDEAFETFDSSYIRRTWDTSGRLINEDIPNDKREDNNRKFNEFTSSPRLRIPSHPDSPGPEGRIEAVRLNDLEFGELVNYSGKPYTGKSISFSDSGVIEVRNFIEGWEFGPYWMWSPKGNLILQGVHCHRSRKVGPWHEWNEQGHLLHETIYDSLGNRIIHRKLDENQNIIKQEYFDPTTLMTDPETGEQRPAPWL